MDANLPIAIGSGHCHDVSRAVVALAEQTCILQFTTAQFHLRLMPKDVARASEFCWLQAHCLSPQRSAARWAQPLSSQAFWRCSLLRGTDLRVMAAALRSVSWSIIPLVAGLFAIVAALQRVGALQVSAHALKVASAWPPIAGFSAVAFGFGIAANAINNLPMGLIGAAAIVAAHSARALHAAVLLGIDLGPNLSVTGSLATILWLIAMRRENIEVSGWRFLRVGILVMPPALFLAVLALVLTQH